MRKTILQIPRSVKEGEEVLQVNPPHIVRNKIFVVVGSHRYF